MVGHERTRQHRGIPSTVPADFTAIIPGLFTFTVDVAYPPAGGSCLKKKANQQQKDQKTVGWLTVVFERLDVEESQHINTTELKS